MFKQMLSMSMGFNVHVSGRLSPWLCDGFKWWLPNEIDDEQNIDLLPINAAFAEFLQRTYFQNLYGQNWIGFILSSRDLTRSTYISSHTPKSNRRQSERAEDVENSFIKEAHHRGWDVHKSQANEVARFLACIYKVLETDRRSMEVNAYNWDELQNYYWFDAMARWIIDLYVV